MNSSIFIFAYKIYMIYQQYCKEKTNIYSEWLEIESTFEENKENFKNLTVFICFWLHI